jgi:hypothetical protein
MKLIYLLELKIKFIQKRIYEHKLLYNDRIYYKSFNSDFSKLHDYRKILDFHNKIIQNKVKQSKLLELKKNQLVKINDHKKNKFD